MLDPNKTVTIEGKKYVFEYPHQIAETEIEVETLRRMGSAVATSPFYTDVYNRVYTDVAMEQCIKEAPPHWYAEVPSLTEPGKKEKRIDLNRFRSYDDEFKNVREAFVEFLRPFRDVAATPEILPENGREAKMDNPPKVPTPPAESKPKGDFGHTSPEH
jgi:hypothetical protein